MHTTQGVVLRKIDAGEADVFLVIYTKDFGKIRALARGVKKEGAKLKGHGEPLNLSGFQFVPGRNGERLTHAELLNYWPLIRQDADKIKIACWVLSLFDQHCFPGQKDEGLWNLLTATLSGLERIPGGADVSFLREFEAKFLECLGYGGEKDMSVLA